MIELSGPWIKGYAFDIHTISSDFTGDNEFGHPTFDTKRSQIGQLLYELKYGQHEEVLSQITDLILSDSSFNSFISQINVILPVPPSNNYRRIQPVRIISDSIAERFSIEAKHDILNSTNKEELKNLESDKKYKKIRDNLKVIKKLNQNDNILIVDDIFDSGSTLQAITDILNENGYKNIYIFTLTKTKGK